MYWILFPFIFLLYFYFCNNVLYNTQLKEERFIERHSLFFSIRWISTIALLKKGSVPLLLHSVMFQGSTSTQIPPGLQWSQIVTNQAVSGNRNM